MRLIERGSGSPRIAVVGGIHGDEPAGERIVDRLADTATVEDGTLQLVVANEPALAAGARYTETDLNRTFPGDIDADEYERALAPRLVSVLEGADAILALHTSQSAPPPFAIYSELTETVRRSVTGMPVEYVVDAGSLRDTTLDSTLPNTISLETGKQGSTDAVEFGLEATRDFLRVHGILAGEPTYTETTVATVDEEVPKGSGRPEVFYENFEEIPEGEVFARDEEYTHRVTAPGTVPVLASEHGYEDIFGLYGRITGTIEPPS
ncbi:Succinylglutamate desuccinylase / Aspartoacylase family protein [Halovenus aranensis]|uniref:Succinylglutamate desuccinylase / Aspartoacylase family protein n=1 Tax=Halovenus aranensis TaxID=890420 RepID=A0A1G8VNZ9_9EURY|nr:succinylglutamate desuccinylase/aspartoacylase family protein [Halovenus aranensis]SDJ67669.1 Succinylglutamate desuccinylase / Aspartoacylase family protein [Halovenus aranensis]